MAGTEIEKTPLWADIRDVLATSNKPIKFEFRGMLHTEKEDYPVLKIYTIDLIRDYANNIGDVLHISFKMPLGEYMVHLYPFRTNLEFTIKRIQLQESDSNKEPDTPIIVERYKAVFLVDENPILTGSELERIDTASLNTVDIIDVKLQLLDRSLEPIRVKTVFGVYRNVTSEQMIHTLLAGESMKVQVDGKPAIDGIDIVEPDNKEVRKHVILPNGSLVIGIPTFMQEAMGGVYSSGIGNYLQKYNGKRLWFVYPLYNPMRFEKSKDDRAIVYAIPQDKFPNIDRTYKKDGKIVSILATAAKRYQDSADIDYMNKGSGFRMADARAFMKKPVKLTDEGPKGKRANLNYEVVAESREDGLNYAPFTSEGASSNPFRQFSRINARNVARIDFIWENCDYEMLYPGMPCKYIFLDDDKPIELKGIIAFVQVLTELQGQGINGTVYRSKCNVTILAEQRPPTRKVPAGKIQGDF